MALNPDVVYVSITGFGESTLPGYDLLVQAVGGLMSVTGAPGEPTKVGVAMVDIVTGLHAAVGLLAALRHRDATGEGQHVEVSLLSSLLSALANQSGAHLMTGAVPRGMATGTRRSPRTRSSRRPIGRWPSPSGTNASWPASPTFSVTPSGLTTPGTPPTPCASSTATSW